MHWYVDVLKKYAVFSGRARRKEYWMFVLVNIVIGCLLGLIEVMAGFARGIDQGVLTSVYSLVVLLPSLAVTVRRLHDTGRSGWWLLIVIAPVIGGLVILYFLIDDGDLGPNQYGPSPKGSFAV